MGPMVLFYELVGLYGAGLGGHFKLRSQNRNQFANTYLISPAIITKGNTYPTSLN